MHRNNLPHTLLTVVLTDEVQHSNLSCRPIFHFYKACEEPVNSKKTLTL